VENPEQDPPSHKNLFEKLASNSHSISTPEKPQNLFDKLGL
jgi:hypothetical protein